MLGVIRGTAPVLGAAPEAESGRFATQVGEDHRFAAERRLPSRFPSSDEDADPRANAIFFIDGAIEDWRCRRGSSALVPSLQSAQDLIGARWVDEASSEPDSIGAVENGSGRFDVRIADAMNIRWALLQQPSLIRPFVAALFTKSFPSTTLDADSSEELNEAWGRLRRSSMLLPEDIRHFVAETETLTSENAVVGSTLIAVFLEE
jgi:hypothetical protein